MVAMTPKSLSMYNKTYSVVVLPNGDSQNWRTTSGMFVNLVKKMSKGRNTTGFDRRHAGYEPEFANLLNLDTQSTRHICTNLFK